MNDKMREMLGALLAEVGWSDAPLDRLLIETRPKVLATPWPIATMACMALGAVGLAASRIHELRTGERRTVHLDTRAAELAMASSSYLQVDGRPVKFRDPFTGFYRASNGEWVYLHGNFPHLRDGLLAMLDVENDPDAIRAAVLEREAGDIEAEAILRGLCAARVRTRADWLAEPHADALTKIQIVRMERVGDAPVMALEDGGAGLSGIRMLDLSRVIAGPMAGRTMAEHGATVLLIASPRLPFIQSLVIDTGFGKHSVHIDLDDQEGPAMLRGLLVDADVFLDAYRPGALSARGFGAQQLGGMKPGLVSISLSAFSDRGPWSGRRGYDSLVQATMGMTSQSDGLPPQLLPCQPLDYLTGYLAAFAAMLGLIRRHEEGGRWHASLSLAATAQWMWRLRAQAGDDAVHPAANPTAAGISDLLAVHDTAFGSVTALKPALRMDGVPLVWSRVPAQLGSDPASWPDV
ncbi:CoA transferase [Rhizobium sp. CECT 9324]|uniref:CoA transferase n=1 Tax=Rhizobium sp. CECT 9324 TaxID=2845820 RepID=UPI001E2849DC|nr:CoA transferase [Rhizobium sp. CECT 9324]CAH0343163.1 Formyl-CoA:oxalate CoA-transferase [Rhizobium sp. CECT 9324]